MIGWIGIPVAFIAGLAAEIGVIAPEAAAAVVVGMMGMLTAVLIREGQRESRVPALLPVPGQSRDARERRWGRRVEFPRLILASNRHGKVRRAGPR